ncbi:MAG TPA: hypothetical protein VMU08_15460 [Rhizomicrobium sp.]|nr:hypothetical protein [Rhizomicrobium sp.]
MNEGSNRLYDANGYEQRASECAKLANATQDVLIQRELLKLRQTYLHIAQRLRQGPAAGPP